MTPLTREQVESYAAGAAEALRKLGHPIKMMPFSALKELCEDWIKMREALEYYACPDHYEERVTLTGIMGPGVLVEYGDKARQALGRDGG